MPDTRLDYNSGFLTELHRPADALRTAFRLDKGVRIGQSTVASQKMHTVEASKPEAVTVLGNVDAGQTFYHRAKAGEVYHLDIFHECGLVDHRLVAAHLKKAIDIYNFQYCVTNVTIFGGSSSVAADMVDVQTGTGGGRITGSLNYGQKMSLRRAHENHVHIAAMLPPEHLACLFYLIMAAEEAVGEVGLELRRNERIIHGQGGGSRADLSAYSDQSDSFLRQKEAGQPSQISQHQYRQDVTDLAEDFDSVQDIKELLSETEGGAGESKLTRSLERRGSGAHALRRLEGMNIVAVTGGKVRLTPYGQEFKDHLERHLPEMEAYLRRTFKLLHPPLYQSGRSKLLAKRHGGTTGPKTLQGRDLVRQPGELAVAETVNAAARRAVAESKPGLAISAVDLQEFIRRRKRKAEICLVIDASASMTGQRIRAAKFLARHLLLSTPDRLGIITFQEDTARVVLPLTRDWRQVEDNLRQISSFGSTPLAGGLQTCLSYLQEAGARDPLIILITDGMPTVPAQSRDPLADALDAAGEIARQGYGFACIGLKPHRKYLEQLAERAGGSIYVLDELEKQALVKTAWNECAGRYW